MKITIETPKPGEEDEIILRVKDLTDDMMQVVRQLRDGGLKDCVPVTDRDSIRMLAVADIYYLDAVDNRVYAYTRNQNFEIRRKLYEIEEASAFASFVRISKNTIVNIRKIDHLSPEFNGRFIARLTNGEKVIVSRGYVPILKKKLGIGK